MPYLSTRPRPDKCRRRDRRARSRRLRRVDDQQGDQDSRARFSGITAPSGFAILINAGATDQINLRGLLIEGLGSGFAGVVVGQVGSLNIQDSLIRKFTEDGIAFSAGNSKLSVSHTVESGNVSAGIAITSASNAMAINAVLEQVELYDNGDGIAVAADRSDAGNQPVQLTVSNSTIANNSNGINCNTSTAQKVSCMVRNSTIANNSNVGVFTFYWRHQFFHRAVAHHDHRKWYRGMGWKRIQLRRQSDRLQ